MTKTPEHSKYAAFGSRLKSMILQHDSSIRSFMRRSGLTSTIFKYVRGETFPPPNVIFTICEALGCSVEDLRVDYLVSEIKLPPEEHSEIEPGEIKKRGRPFKPGVSGHPAGCIRTKQEKEAVAAVKGLIPGSTEKLRAILESPDASAFVKFKICKMILYRTYGKPKSAEKMVSDRNTAEQSMNYIQELSSRAAGDGKVSDIE